MIKTERSLHLETAPSEFTYRVKDAVLKLFETRNKFQLPTLNPNLLIDLENCGDMFDALEELQHDNPDYNVMFLCLSALSNEVGGIEDDIEKRDMLQRAALNRIKEIEANINSANLHGVISPDLQTEVTSQSTYQDFLNRLLSKGPVSKLGEFIEPSAESSEHIQKPQNNVLAELPKI